MSKLRQLGHKLTFFGNLLPRNQDQNLPLVFCKIWTSKITSNGRWLRDTVLLGEEEVVFTPREITGGWLKSTACGNASSQALSQPPMKMHYQANRLCKMHLHRRLAALRPFFLYHRRVITKTACGIKRGRRRCTLFY
jgi:hypothetical protein